MRQLKRWVILVLACDLNTVDGGRTLGAETIARCQKALKRYRTLSYNFSPIIVLAAGMGRNKKRYPNQPHTMARMMGEWFVAQGVPMKDIEDISRPEIWGTRREVVATMNFVSTTERSGCAFEGIELVSSDYHAMRLALLANRTIRANRMALPQRPVVRSVRLPSPLRKMEPHKIAGEFILGLLRPSWYRFG